MIFSSVCTEPADACGVCTHCIKQNNRDDTGTGIHQDESDILDGIMYVMAVANVGTLSFIESICNAKPKGILKQNAFMLFSKAAYLNLEGHSFQMLCFFLKILVLLNFCVKASMVQL